MFDQDAKVPSSISCSNLAAHLVPESKNPLTRPAGKRAICFVLRVGRFAHSRKFPLSEIGKRDNNTAKLAEDALRTAGYNGHREASIAPFSGKGRHGKVARGFGSVLEARMTNAKLIERLMECWNTGKVDGLDQVFSENFVRHEPDLRSSTREDYKEIIRHYHEVLTDFHSEPVDVIEQGNKVVFRFRTTAKKDNTPVVFEGVNIVWIEGNRIVENWVYFDVTGVRAMLARAQSAS
jgi:ketosteroid isomerase-like protein